MPTHETAQHKKQGTETPNPGERKRNEQSKQERMKPEISQGSRQDRRDGIVSTPPSCIAKKRRCNKVKQKERIKEYHTKTDGTDRGERLVGVIRPCNTEKRKCGKS